MPPIETGPGEPARALGERMDRFLGLLGRIPGWAWTICAAITLIWTYPADGRARVIAGVELRDRLTVWFSNVVVIFVLAAAASASFFVVRSLLHYLERGRWPKRAVGVEMEEISEIEGQLTQNADELVLAAGQTRMFMRELDEARATIVFLKAELARARGTGHDSMGQADQLADDQ